MYPFISLFYLNSHAQGKLLYRNAKCLYATKESAAEYFTLLNSFVQLFDPAQIASSPKQCKLFILFYRRHLKGCIYIVKFIGFSLLHLAEVTEEVGSIRGKYGKKIY